MEKFDKSNASEAWFIFKNTGNIEDCRMWLAEMQELDKAKKKESEEIEIQ